MTLATTRSSLTMELRKARLVGAPRSTARGRLARHCDRIPRFKAVYFNRPLGRALHSALAPCPANSHRASPAVTLHMPEAFPGVRRDDTARRLTLSTPKSRHKAAWLPTCIEHGRQVARGAADDAQTADVLSAAQRFPPSDRAFGRDLVEQRASSMAMAA